MSKAMNYNPINGLRFIERHNVTNWRKNWPDRPWRFNPWTGHERQPEDIQADPLGQYIAVPAH